MILSFSNSVSAISISEREPTYSNSSSKSLYINTNKTTDNKLQLRASCYGYAMRFFCSEALTDLNLHTLPDNTTYYSYEQNPGDFYYNTVPNNNSFARVWTNMTKDALVLGYSLSTVSLNPTSSSVITSNVSTTSRLLILVFNSTTDIYHFYMRNANGYWTHKPGDDPARNTCSVCRDSSNNYIVLTDSNILNHINCNGFSNATTLLFSTTDIGAVDRSHSARSTTSKSVVYYSDCAGEYYKNSDVLNSYGTSLSADGHMNYNGDVDHWVYVAPATGSYTINIVKPTGYELEIWYGALITWNPIYLASCFTATSSQTSKTVTTNLTQGQLYCIQISRSDSPGNYFDNSCWYSLTVTKIN